MKQTYKNHFTHFIINLLFISIFFSTSVIPVYATETEVTEEEASDAFLHIDDWPTAPDIVGEAALLIEAESGVILYDKNSNKQLYPASLTKLITALLVLEHCSLDETVTFSRNSIFSLPTGASHIAINPGEELSVEQCLYGLLLASANEVANALAEHVSGSISNFAKLMNEKLEDIGALNSHCVNPSGLHSSEHYTTCYDMYLVCRELIDNEEFLKINGTAAYVIPPTNLQSLQRPMSTTHKLLKKGSTNYEGAFGGKTGSTSYAGNTLITFAKRNDMTLICIVMKSGADTVYTDTKALLDYGFSSFQKVNVSEFETSFDFTKKTPNTSEHSLFVNPNPSLEISEDDYVYIPVTADFKDLKCTLTELNRNEGVFSKLIYTFNDHFVGEASLLSTPSTVSDSTEPDNITEPDETPKRIIEIHPIHIIIFASVFAVIMIIIIYLKLTRINRIRRKRIKRQKRIKHRRRRGFR